jgi:hypothetical protein
MVTHTLRRANGLQNDRFAFPINGYSEKATKLGFNGINRLDGISQ